MKQVFKGLLVAAAVTFSATTALTAYAGQLDTLLEQVKKDRISEGKINAQREQEFLSAKADKQALLNKAIAAQKAEKAREEALKKEFAQNESTLVVKEKELEDAKGSLGEIFGTVRKNASDSIASITNSVVSAQYPGREKLLDSLAVAKELPTLPELEELWIALQTEMTESSKVSTFSAEVVSATGDKTVESVTRIGSFNLVGDDKYLIYVPETKQILPLGRPAESHQLATVNSLLGTPANQFAGVYLDPSRGSLLRLNTQRATLEDQFEAGGTIGYIITAVLAVGLIVVLERLLTLSLIGGKIRRQLKNVANPTTDNPLGRIIKVYHDNKSVDVETLELKLDEATLRELPVLERGINLIKIFAAIAPLLGLLGTVTGMIETFQMITLHGTGDPKIMAGSISLALVTTAQGLIAALPLILLHTVVAAKAKSVVHILDEQSAGIIAAHAEKE